MKHFSLFIITLFVVVLVSAQNKDTAYKETPIVLQTATGSIYGTLCTPDKGSNFPVALIIAGSGPTDRNCNSAYIKTDAYKVLAHQLSNEGIATVRYDKRGIAESSQAMKSEAELRFDTYINDAKDWIHLLKGDKRFSEVILIGHSEGSLIGMAAAGEADKYISIAGAGQPANEILKQQLNTQPQQVKEAAFPILDSLASGKTVASVNPMLFALFRPSVQPYMISWFKYNPQTEIKKLTIPVLIVQGTKDLQVAVEDANLLAAALPKAKLVIIENMNHIFRIVTGGQQQNLKTYNDPSLPISSELVQAITTFIKK